ncbi:helix-turn-helix domain-containing protein [Trabulsiella odontotermitis]|uniref:helix-turn-helix domain-containing protein n=1 Tax=Trabulsiella odontotermitis TaxID=379893 RepID=UPI00092CEE3D|nr:helix-turn-helix domain-containing protein [Trabulsiella odontotermitis]
MTFPHNYLVIQELLFWIESNIQKPLFIEDVAKHAGYSKWYLQRLFSKYTGRSLANYIKRRKMELAANDLCCTSEKIIDISIKYGFDSQQSFTRAFRKIYNQSPAVYRKRMSEHKK